jgi:hypothetical protein
VGSFIVRKEYLWNRRQIICIGARNLLGSIQNRAKGICLSDVQKTIITVLPLCGCVNSPLALQIIALLRKLKLINSRKLRQKIYRFED